MINEGYTPAVVLSTANFAGGVGFLRGEGIYPTTNAGSGTLSLHVCEKYNPDKFSEIASLRSQTATNDCYSYTFKSEDVRQLAAEFLAEIFDNRWVTPSGIVQTIFPVLINSVPKFDFEKICGEEVTKTYSAEEVSSFAAEVSAALESIGLKVGYTKEVKVTSSVEHSFSSYIEANVHVEMLMYGQPRVLQDKDVLLNSAECVSIKHDRRLYVRRDGRGISQADLEKLGVFQGLGLEDSRV